MYEAWSIPRACYRYSNTAACVCTAMPAYHIYLFALVLITPGSLRWYYAKSGNVSTNSIRLHAYERTWREENLTAADAHELKAFALLHNLSQVIENQNSVFSVQGNALTMANTLTVSYSDNTDTLLVQSGHTISAGGLTVAGGHVTIAGTRVV